MKVEHSDYSQGYLGDFIYSKMNPKRSVKNGSGTLTTDYKNKLSTYILKQVEVGELKWSDLLVSKPIKDITEGLYEFILKCNGIGKK